MLSTYIKYKSKHIKTGKQQCQTSKTQQQLSYILLEFPTQPFFRPKTMSPFAQTCLAPVRQTAMHVGRTLARNGFRFYGRLVEDTKGIYNIYIYTYILFNWVNFR